MTELETIQRAKMYMANLHRALIPFPAGTAVGFCFEQCPPGSVLFYVSGVLD